MWYIVVFQPSKCKKFHFQPQIWSIWPIFPNDSESLPKVCYINWKNSEILSKLRISEPVEVSGLLTSHGGLRGSKMIQNNQYNIFFTIWDYFGPIWTLLDLFIQTWFFASKTEKCFLAKVIWSKKLSFVWKDPKESKWAQNGPKWSKICYSDHFGPS